MAGIALRDRTLKLLELGGRLDDTIVTEMIIGREGQTDHRIDVNDFQPDQMVCFEVNQHEFTWKKIEA